MSSTSLSLISYLRSIAGAWRDDPRDDAELLARFVADGRDEAAFKVLVARHGAMVWRSCARILGNGPETEDAFQIAFLTFARKARRLAIKNPAGWLHQVARRAALDVQAKLQRRRVLEKPLHATSQPAAENNIGKDASQTEVYTVLDEELAGLSEHLRVALVLRYLEGKKLEEVARILGVSVRAVTKRLSRGETALRKRLEQRGVGVSGVAALLTGSVTTSTVPARLIDSTARAAVAFRAGALTSGAADAAQKLLRALSIEGGVRASWCIVLATFCILGVGGVGLVAWKMFGGSSDKVMPSVPDMPKTELPKVTPSNQNKERMDRFGDPLPEGALARIGTLRLRLGIGGWRGGIAFMPDGKTLVSVLGKDLYFWDWSTGKQLRRIDRTESNDGVIAISPNGKMLVVGRGQYWDLTVDPPKRLKREKVSALLASCKGVAFSPDSKTVAWGTRDPKTSENVVLLCDAATGKVIRTLKHADGQNLAFAPDGKTLAIGGGAVRFIGGPADGVELALWDVETGVKRLQIADIGGQITFLAFLPDGRTLLESRCNGNDLIGMLAALDGPERMRFLDAATGKEQQLASIARTLSPSRYRMGAKCLSPDGKLLALNNFGVISIWDMVTGREVGPAGGIHSPVSKLVFSLDGKKLVTLSAGEGPWMYVMPALQIWETDTGRLERELEMPRSTLALPSVCCSDDRHLELLYMDLTEKTCSLRWDIETGKKEEVNDLQIPANLVSSLKKSSHCHAISSGGHWQALELTEGIAIVDRSTGKEVRRIRGTRDPGFVTFASDGQSALTCVGSAKNPRLELWSVASGKQRISLSGPVFPDENSETLWPYDQPWRYALSTDGRWLAVACSDMSGKRSVRLIEMTSGMAWEDFAAPEKITRMAWSPDGRFLAGGDANGTVWLWDMVIGREVNRFIGGHLSDVTALAFSPNGARLASGSADTTVLIWDLRSLLHSNVFEKDKLPVDTLWVKLKGKDPAVARRAIYSLTQVPDAALSLLRERMLPAPTPDPKRVENMLNQLNDDNFQVRSRAMEQLEKMGEGIESTLLGTLAKKPSLDVSRNIDEVLHRIFGSPIGSSGLNAKQLQACRGVEVLERIGTSAARQVLDELSQLPSEYIQSTEAKAALYRMSKSTTASRP